MTFCQAHGLRLEKVFDPFFGHRVNVYPPEVLQAFFRDKGIVLCPRTGRHDGVAHGRAWPGKACLGAAWIMAWQGQARPVKARRCGARSMARQWHVLGQARQGEDRGEAWLCKAGRGQSRPGRARIEAGRGCAGRGEAGLGEGIIEKSNGYASFLLDF